MNRITAIVVGMLKNGKITKPQFPRHIIGMEEKMRAIDLWQTEREKAEDLGVLKALKGECLKGPTLKMWLPKAIKPFSNYYYRSVEARDNALQLAIESQKKHQAFKKERKQSRKGNPELLNKADPGAIFHWSWGYDQTQCDFFQVIERNGQMVKVRQIASKTVPGSEGSMSDNRIAVKDSFLEKEPILTKRVQFSNDKPYLSMEFGWCDLWDGQAQYCSWYA